VLGAWNFCEAIMRYIVIIIIILLIIIIPAGYFLNLFYLSSPRADEPTIKFIIEKGEGVGKISYKLKEGGIIGSRLWFETFVWLKGVSGNFQYGIFDLKPGMSYKKIVDLTTVPQTLENQITIIEGWDLRDIGSYFESHGSFKVEDLWSAVGAPAVDYRKKDLPKLVKNLTKDYSFLSDKPNYAGLEGYLFPDTYRISKDASLESVVKKMLDNFDKKLSQDLRDEIKKQGRTIFSVITMASIIEKEVKTYEDRQMVSDIFWRRLRGYMPLQADSTVNYVTGGNAPAVSYADKAVDSPWNTYKNQGLPLGPICNPGLEAIKAAIYPKQNPYLYFLTTPDGQVIYSKTLDEHNKNKAKYLK
jgi:UPF0755 protein